MATLIMLEETKKASNWKAPGKNGIANFWIKNFLMLSLYKDLINAYNECFGNPEIALTG